VQFRPHTDPRPNGYTAPPAAPRSVYTGDPALIQAEKYGMHVAGRAITMGMHLSVSKPYGYETSHSIDLDFFLSQRDQAAGGVP
jgi:hypothetical protein